MNSVVATAVRCTAEAWVRGGDHYPAVRAVELTTVPELGYDRYHFWLADDPEGRKFTCTLHGEPDIPFEALAKGGLHAVAARVLELRYPGVTFTLPTRSPRPPARSRM